MKIQVASDIHLEFFEDTDVLPRIEALGNVLALVGDIGYPKHDLFGKFIREHADSLAGNHEFYMEEYYDSIRDMENIAKNFDNVHFMNKKSFLYTNPVDETDVVRILGVTLWSHIPDDEKSYIKRAMNDYHLVSIIPKETTSSNCDDLAPKRKLTPDDTNRFHEEEVAWLEEEITKAEMNNENVVILTHHAPILNGTSAPEFDDSPNAVAFATDLSRLMKKHVKLWLFGHTHFSSQQVIPETNTIVASNQMGYKEDSDVGYKEDLVFTVQSRANDKN